MGGQERLIYLWDGAEWVKALGDGAGHFQVDILTAPALISHIYGYDGANWQTVLVESAASPNLRARLYDGANGIDSQLADTGLTTERGLVTVSAVQGYEGADVLRRIQGLPANVDGHSGAYYVLGTLSHLHGFDGANWDRLRTYLTGILKVGRAEVGLLTVRMTAVGQVGAAGARRLYWMTMNPTAAASVVELTDDTDGSTAVVWDMTHGVNSAHHMNMDPPMEFTNGIWLKTFTNFTSIIFGYL